MNKENTKRWITTLLVMMLTFMGLGQTMVHAVEGNGTTEEYVECPSTGDGPSVHLD